ncbi:MAG: hypothetical protein QXI61_00625 [Nitrososphaerota archaeon]
MTGAFEKALEWIKGEVDNGKPLSTIMLTMPTFRDNELVINKIYSFNPLIIGYSGPELNIELDSKMILKVNWIAKNFGMNVVFSPPDIHILRGNEPVGVVKRDGFGASDPILLSELNRHIGRLSNQYGVKIEVKDSWIKSAKILSMHRQSRRILLVALFIIILPTSLVLSISLTYPYILGGGLIALSIPIIVFLVTSIAAYLYFRRETSISRIKIQD